MTESLDVLLYNCTNVENDALDALEVAKFCDAVNQDLDGHLTAARLLGHKIQSPQEQESLNALCVADECVKQCGRRFQDEIGKFRFLNEIIKMISPKYFGDRTSKKVKDKCIELLYRWSVELRHEPKIDDAYQMLKKQGIVEDDPVFDDPPLTNLAEPQTGEEVNVNGTEAASSPTPEGHHDSIFADEDKSKLLAKLLRSKHPDDLQAANTLIKNMVKQDEEKQEKISQRFMLLETVKNNVRLLGEMLDCYQMAGGSSNSDQDIIKELHQNIEAERPKLFKLASETEDKDAEGMTKILQVNDDVVQISARYKQVITEGGDSNLLGISSDTPSAERKPETNGASSLEEELANLAAFNSPAPSAPKSTTPAPGSASADLFSAFAAVNPPPAATSDPLAAFTDFQSTASFHQAPVSVGLNLISSNSLRRSTTTTTAAASSPVATAAPKSSADTSLLSLDDPTSNPALAAPLLPASDELSLFDSAPPMGDDEMLFDTRKSALEELDLLGKDLLDKSKPTQPVLPATSKPVVMRPSLDQLKQTNVSSTLSPSSVANTKPVMSAEVQPLSNVTVPLQSIQPDAFPPANVYNKNDVKLVVHFAKNKPRPDVSTMVVSIMSSRSEPVRSIVFQAAVPKSMKVKLQPPTTTELPSFNPILPPSAVTQVMLLANPNKERVKMKYKLSYKLLSGDVTEMGDITQFPV